MVIGVAGGICSGKTVATNRMRDFGITVIDADEVSRDLLKDGSPLCNLILREFGDISKGAGIDRVKLKNIVFSDETALKKLNEITHPAIICDIKNKIALANGNAVVSCALLYSSGLNSLCDKIIAFNCDLKTRLARLTKRDNITQELALNMINAQAKELELIKNADIIISSQMPIDEYLIAIDSLIKKIKLQSL